MIELLADLDLFQGVDDETLAAFAAHGVEGTLPVGGTVTVQGKPVERFVVIAEGTIEWSRCINGVDMVLSERHGPTYSGASNLLTGDPAVATGRASTPAHVITWDADSFLAFLQETPLAMRTAVRLIAPIAQAAESIVRQQEKLAALGTLSAGLAHEMRNPANAIVNAVEPLRELLPADLTTAESPTGQLIRVLADCAEQLGALSRHLLGYRRAGELERRNHPLQEVVSSALSLTGPVLESVELKQELGYAGPVSCAGPLLTQALANLLENAAQAAGKGGWVRLASRVEERALVVEVSDSGSGVPRELRERIFEPFFTTKPPGEGTGLGLTTARDIVRRHNGTLDIRDLGDRAVFHIEIPLQPEAGHDRA